MRSHTHTLMYVCMHVGIYIQVICVYTGDMCVCVMYAHTHLRVLSLI